MLGGSRKHQLGGPELPKKKKISYPETKAQRAVVAWLRKRPDWMVMRLENALKRNDAQVMRDKSLGMEPGAPDLVLMYKTTVVFLEMKALSGNVSKVQEQIHEQLSARGAIVFVGFGEERTIAMLEAFERAAT